jgi:hypothetical protein
VSNNTVQVTKEIYEIEYAGAMTKMAKSLYVDGFTNTEGRAK